MGPIIVTLIRLVIPLTIFRWPLLGGLLSLVVDALDVVFITVLSMGDFSNYHMVDKYLDMYYLSIEAYMSFKWTNPLARRTSLILFVYRAVGFVLFEVTKMRVLLFMFPNLFENFYLFYLGWQKLTKKDPVTSVKSLLIILAILLIPKMAQEYLLHFVQAQPWNWMKTHISHTIK